MWSYVYVISPLQILTYAGSSVSVLSLLILVVVYGMFKELRTLPGKNLINLSFAMMFYHVFLFVAGSRNIEGLCIVIAILLHYFLLSSFAWMSVMAFDVAKTFVFRGKGCFFRTFNLFSKVISPLVTKIGKQEKTSAYHRPRDLTFLESANIEPSIMLN